MNHYEERLAHNTTCNNLCKNIMAEISAGFAEIKKLEEQQKVFLTKAGKRHARNSPARAKWNAFAEQIKTKQDEINRLFHEMHRVTKEWQTAASDSCRERLCTPMSIESAVSLLF